MKSLPGVHQQAGVSAGNDHGCTVTLSRKRQKLLLLLKTISRTVAVSEAEQLTQNMPDSRRDMHEVSVLVDLYRVHPPFTPLLLKPEVGSGSRGPAEPNLMNHILRLEQTRLIRQVGKETKVKLEGVEDTENGLVTGAKSLLIPTFHLLPAALTM